MRSPWDSLLILIVHPGSVNFNPSSDFVSLMAIQSSVSAQGISPPFDRFSFVKYVKNIGSAYRKQAMELISFCRTFVQAQLQDFRSHGELRR